MHAHTVKSARLLTIEAAGELGFSQPPLLSSATRLFNPAFVIVAGREMGMVNTESTMCMRPPIKKISCSSQHTPTPSRGRADAYSLNKMGFGLDSSDDGRSVVEAGHLDHLTTRDIGVVWVGQKSRDK